MNTPDILSAIKPVIHVFQQLGIDYYIGGSVASSTYGMPRATMDVDMVTNFTLDCVDEFVNMLESTHYVSSPMIRDAIQNHSSFNLIHLDTMMKVDIFILKPRSFDQQAFQRKREDTLDDADPMSFFLGAPEDILLNKLEWYHLGNRISERQWGDIIGILEIQRDQLDIAYLKDWANELELKELLERALHESGLSRS